MNKKTIFSLTTALCLAAVTGAYAMPVGTGIALIGVEEHGSPSCVLDPVCMAGDLTPPYNFYTSIWLDPGLIAATGLDLLATMDQNERIIDCEDALDELDETLGSNYSTTPNTTTSNNEDNTNTSLSGQDTVVVAPDEIVNILKDDNLKISVVAKDDLFDSVRSAVENYVFYTDNMDLGACGDLKPEDCILERQNTWLLTSVTMAAATGDKLLAATKAKGGKDPLEDEFEDLVAKFNGEENQNNPTGMWSSSSQITLHTHIQQNDINALYARDLEMNALNGVRESDDTRLLKK